MSTTNLSNLDPETRVAYQLSKIVSPTSTGDAWNAMGGEQLLRSMANTFIQKTGITDLENLGVRPKTQPTSQMAPMIGGRRLTPEEARVLRKQGVLVNVVEEPTQYYNKETNQNITFDGRLGDYSQGNGITYAELKVNNGQVSLATNGVETGFNLQELLPIAAMALMAVPGLGTAVGSAILPAGVSTATATAVGNAVVSAGMQVASGVPVEQAITNAAVTLGVNQVVPNLSGNTFVDNAVKSVATAALTGGDVGTALANSLIATGGADLLGNASFTGDTVADSAIASAITSGVQAAATGGDVAQSIVQGAVRGASGQITREEEQATRAASGAGFVGDTESQAAATDTVAGGAVADTVAGGATEADVLDLVAQDQGLTVDQSTNPLIAGQLVGAPTAGNAALVQTGLDTTTGAQIDPNTGLPIDPEAGVPRLDVSGTSDTEIEDREGAAVGSTFGDGAGTSFTATTPAAQETLKTLGGIIGLGAEDPDAIYRALFGGALGAEGGQAILGFDSLVLLQDQVDLILEDPSLSPEARNEITKIRSDIIDKKNEINQSVSSSLQEDITAASQLSDAQQNIADSNLAANIQTGGDLVSDLDANLGVTAEQTGATSDGSGASLTVSPVVAEQPAPSVPVSPNIVTTPAVVLQNNNDGTALVLTQDGNATNVNATDSNTGNQLTAGDTVTVNNQDNTATTTTVITGGDGGGGDLGGGSQNIPAVLPAQNVSTDGAASARDEQNILDLINQGDGMGGGEGDIVSAPSQIVTSGVGSDVRNRQDILDLINQGEATGGGGGEGGGVPSVITGGGGGVTGGDLASGGDVTSGVTGGDIGAVTGGDSIAGGGGGEGQQDVLLLEDTAPGGLINDTTPGGDLADLTGGGVDLGGEVTDAELIDLITSDLITSDLDADTTDTTEITDTTDTTDITDVTDTTDITDTTDTAAETPTQDVTGGTKISVLPTRVPRPRPPPGSRVTEVDAAGLLPLRPGLSEGGTDGIEGTTEEEQKPVWNVRSLKLRRALGI
jgi:hypothetical protein